MTTSNKNIKTYYFSDPLLKNIIEKRLNYCFYTQNDKLLLRYLNYIKDSLPVNGREIEEEEQDLFLELVEILTEHQDHKLVKKFLKNKIFQKHLLSNLNFNALHNIYQIKSVSEFNTEDVTPYQN